MFHFTYKTINLITGKVYIGAHSTNNINDNYLGSGKQLKDAIKKYGAENFTREILEFFNTREEAFEKESNLVTEDFIKQENNYNMCPGGLGCSVKTKKFKAQVSNKLKGRILSDDHKKKISQAQIGEKNHRYGVSNPNNPKLFGKDNGMFGKNHSAESKKLMSEKRKGVKITYTNELKSVLSLACKGKLWYNDGTISKRFYENEQPLEFNRGRLKK